MKSVSIHGQQPTQDDGTVSVRIKGSGGCGLDQSTSRGRGSIVTVTRLDSNPKAWLLAVTISRGHLGSGSGLGLRVVT
jgi:hypothetical protein